MNSISTGFSSDYNWQSMMNSEPLPFDETPPAALAPLNKELTLPQPETAVKTPKVSLTGNSALFNTDSFTAAALNSSPVILNSSIASDAVAAPSEPAYSVSSMATVEPVLDVFIAGDKSSSLSTTSYNNTAAFSSLYSSSTFGLNSLKNNNLFNVTSLSSPLSQSNLSFNNSLLSGTTTNPFNLNFANSLTSYFSPAPLWSSSFLNLDLTLGLSLYTPLSFNSFSLSSTAPLTF
jgi:hypothetical protein